MLLFVFNDRFRVTFNSFFCSFDFNVFRVMD